MRRKQRSRPGNRSRHAPGGTVAKDRVQYTVRDVPLKADQALRRKAEELRISLNDVLRTALMKEAGMVAGEGHVYHDLDAFIGSWQEDPEFDAIIAQQDRVDEEMWK